MGNITIEFEKIYRDNYRKIKYYIKHRVRIDADAEDLTQEVFICCMQKIRKGDNIVNIMTWLLQMARFMLNNHYRQKWNRYVVCDENSEVFIDKYPSPYPIISETRAIIQEILCRDIKDPHASILLLIGAYQYSRRDVSAAFSMSYHQVLRNYKQSCYTMRYFLSRKGIHTCRDLL